MIHVIVRERDATAQATEPITSGSVGLECSFRFSEDWDSLGKVAIFQGSGQIIDVALVGQESCAVPHEVLQQALGHLKIGVYGTGEQGQRVTPTIWADAGRILPGVEPSQIEPTPATQSLVQQILEAAENAEELAQSVRDDADAGEFDGADGVSPSVTVTDITGGHRITIVDAQGTHVFDVLNGEHGEKGDDGFSPEVNVYPMTGGNRIVIVDAEGQHTFDVMNGLDGDPGEDGISPEVSVVQTAGGHRVIIIDSRGTNQFDVLDGTDGDPGVYVGPTAPTDPTVRVWIDTSGDPDETDVFWATYNTTTEAEVTAAVTAGKAVLCKISDEVFYLVNKAAIGPSGSAWLFASANQTSMRVTFVSGSYWNTISTRTIPTKTSDLTNDSGFITGYTETDPTVPSWAKASSKPSYTASEVGAIAAPSSPATGAFLVWNGTAWVAQTMSAWQGGNY